VIRTSETHPLQIASVKAGRGYGRIGITFCPGKKQPMAMTGAWSRDLSLDLDAINAWGAVAIVTLIEDHELQSLAVTKLGEEARRRHIEWLHLPIADVSVPCSRFEEQWISAGESLRARLRSGFDVLVHCKGGLGRAGMIAARLMVELGADPDAAIAAVRQARPGAIETRAQVEHVRRCCVVHEVGPPTQIKAVQDRAIGGLLGLAIGDAVGTTLEFRTRDSYEPLTDMVGGGPFRLKPGEWTDDTAMALALADSLLQPSGFDEADLMRRFLAWRDTGAYSCTGTCFDIGMTVSKALQKFSHTGDPIAGSTDPMSAGNGSLMRLAPVALRYWNDQEQLSSIAARQSTATHAAPEAISACVGFSHILADAMQGLPRSQVLRKREGDNAGRIKEILEGSWRGKPRHQISSSGYVAHSLEAALWAVARTATFEDAVLTAANLGGDADTTAAITGQLAGALYGESAIPQQWLERVAWRLKIKDLAFRLFVKSGD
jgi:ADP-ribosyl-[dinitrogen reductase] hydrolase